MNNMPKLLGNTIGLLEKMYDQRACLFSSSARLKDGEYINDFSSQSKYRYTLNVLIGLQKLNDYYRTHWDLGRIIEKYLSELPVMGLSLGDRGLLLHALALANHEQSRQIYISLYDALKNRSKALRHTVQDISWASMGITTYATKKRDRDSNGFAREVINYLHQDLMNGRTLLPQHNRGIRGGFVSFGGITYFLIALEHFSRAFDDHDIRKIFKGAVGKVLALQGEYGEWPWFIDSSSGKIMDWYQVYSVHQDSMAMLFLLPAFDMGVKDSEEAIIKSYSWLFGNNQLNERMIQDKPFFIYRSIRRKSKIEERPLRLLRSFGNKIIGRNAILESPDSLEINKECRSYHLGWILYAWAGRNDFSEFTKLKCLPC
jgi:hypothetical protein